MLKVQVCVGTSCSFNGGLDILDYLEHDMALKGKIEIVSARCFNKACKPDNSPVIMIGDELLINAKLDKVLLKIGEKLNDQGNQ